MKGSTRRPREKRPNGEGGIWFSESEGRWRAQYADQHGKTRSLSAKTEADVTRRLDKAIADRDAGILGGLPSMTPTIGEWLDHWLESRDDLKPRSRDQLLVGELGGQQGHELLVPRRPQGGCDAGAHDRSGAAPSVRA